jgi:UDP-2,4-diacetamido-2,4,6-trideoxy-beta-L-altropyranose hydrolase
MNVVIRADASVNIGSGHVMRCLVLAEALKEKNYLVTFVCRSQPGDMVSFIKERGFDVVCLDEIIPAIQPKNSADYLAWLQCPIEKDTNDFLSRINNADIVVTDHYAIGKEWQSIVREKLNCRIVAIDDLNRLHDADLIIDQNLWRDLELRYSSCKGRKLLGPKYALLRPSFKKLKKIECKVKDQVIVFFGGSDLTKECFKLVKALSYSKSLPFSVKIVAGRSNPNFKELLELSQNVDIEIVRYLDNFDIELRYSKYVIGASGVSNWERFCLQVPASVVSVAENQIELSEYLAELDLIRYLGSSNETTANEYLDELAYLKLNWSKIVKPKSVDVDGLGVTYIVDEIGKM